MRKSVKILAQTLLIAAIQFIGNTKALADQWVTLGTSGGPSVQTHRSQIANALVVKIPSCNALLFEVHYIAFYKV